MRKTYKIVKQELEKCKISQQLRNLPKVKGNIDFKMGDCVYLKNEAKTEGKKKSNKYSGPYRIVKKYDSDFTFKMANTDNGRTYKAHVSRIKRAKFPERWVSRPLSTDSSDAEDEPSKSRLAELKPLNFKQDYFENDSDEENFEEFLAMKNIVIPKRKSLVQARIKPPKIPESSSSESAGELDYTISPKTQFFLIEFPPLVPPKDFQMIWFPQQPQ
jgi:uncharacterized protein Veg